MTSCGKNSTMSLQKLPSSISLDENVVRYEGEIWLGKIACKVQETWREIYLAFCFSRSYVHISFPGLQCKFSLLLHGNHLLWDNRVWGKGSERGAKGHSSVWAELCAGDGSLLGDAGFLPAIASTFSIHWWANHKTLGTKHMYKNASISIRLLGVYLFADASTIWPQHRVMPCTLHILTC